MTTKKGNPEQGSGPGVEEILLSTLPRVVVLGGEAHHEQDLERDCRRGKMQSVRAWISSEPRWTESMESLQEDLYTQQRSFWLSSSRERKAASRKGKTGN